MLSVLMTLLVSTLAFAQADVAGNWRVEFVVAHRRNRRRT